MAAGTARDIWNGENIGDRVIALLSESLYGTCRGAGSAPTCSVPCRTKPNPASSNEWRRDDACLYGEQVIVRTCPKIDFVTTPSTSLTQLHGKERTSPKMKMTRDRSRWNRLNTSDHKKDPYDDAEVLVGNGLDGMSVKRSPRVAPPSSEDSRRTDASGVTIELGHHREVSADICEADARTANPGALLGNVTQLEQSLGGYRCKMRRQLSVNGELRLKNEITIEDSTAEIEFADI